MSQAHGEASEQNTVLDAVDVTARLDELADEVRELATVALPTASLEQLDACLAALLRIDGAVRSVEAQAIDCAARSRVHREAGTTDTTSYVRDRLRLSAREAKRRTQLATDLAVLPETAEAVADGRLGVEQAGALGRAARDGRLGDAQETEQQLLETATRSTPERLREDIRRRQQQADPEALRDAENLAYFRRRATCSRRTDGMWELYALLDPDAGERVATALQAHTHPDASQTPIKERRSPAQRAADGLVELAEAALRGGSSVVGGVRPHVNVTIPVEGLDPEARVVGVTDHRATLSPQLVQRLLCDASVTRILTRGVSEILDIGRATREWSSSQRRAIVVRDGGCRGPGCDRPPAWCDIHHLHFWSDGGRTDLDNGLMLCRHHHRLLHEHRWTVEYDPATGKASFQRPGDAEPVVTWPHTHVFGRAADAKVVADAAVVGHQTDRAVSDGADDDAGEVTLAAPVDGATDAAVDGGGGGATDAAVDGAGGGATAAALDGAVEGTVGGANGPEAADAEVVASRTTGPDGEVGRQPTVPAPDEAREPPTRSERPMQPTLLAGS